MKYIKYKVIDSTQKEAWRLYESGNSDICISSDIQCDAIGTHGRVWYTEERNNIAFSILYVLNANIALFEGLTYKVALIITDIFKKKYGVLLDIKKPNDLMINGKKVGGILLQTKIEKDVVKALVIGIGINTNQCIFNENIKNIATSIALEFDVFVDENDFIKCFSEKFGNELKERKIL